MDKAAPGQYRRALLKKGTVLIACIAGMPLAPETAVAARADRALLGYQDHPRNGKTCARCWAYVAARGASQPSCKAIEGPVSPTGWCMAYSPK